MSFAKVLGKTKVKLLLYIIKLLGFMVILGYNIIQRVNRDSRVPI